MKYNVIKNFKNGDSFHRKIKNKSKEFTWKTLKGNI